MIIWPPSQIGDLPIPATFQQAALHTGAAAAAVTAVPVAVPAAGAAALLGIPVLALRTRLVRARRRGRLVSGLDVLENRPVDVSGWDHPLISTIVEFFIAPGDDAASAVAGHGPDGVYEAARYGNFSPSIAMGEWESAFGIVPDNGPRTVASDGLSFVFAASASLHAALAAADEEQLAEAATRWAGLRADHGEEIYWCTVESNCVVFATTPLRHPVRQVAVQAVREATAPCSGLLDRLATCGRLDRLPGASRQCPAATRSVMPCGPAPVGEPRDLPIDGQ
jgi:hypothetical protein